MHLNVRTLRAMRARVRRMIKNIISQKIHYLSRFATGRDELVFFRLCSRRAAETSDVAGYSDCRHVCDDESHHENLDEGDHVHEDHDDHCSASGSEAPLVMFSRFDCTN